MGTKMIAYIYTRVSSKKQAEDNRTSLASQKQQCLNYCALHNFTVEKVVEESASASSINKQRKLRDLYQTLLQDTDVQPNKKAKLVVYSLDRLGRNIIDVLTLVGQLAAIGVTIASVTQDYDFSTVDGAHMMRNIISNAQLERELISRRVKASIAFRTARGDVFGYIPYGQEAYKDPVTGARKTRPNKAEVDIIRLIRKYRGINMGSLGNDLPSSAQVPLRSGGSKKAENNNNAQRPPNWYSQPPGPRNRTTQRFDPSPSPRVHKGKPKAQVKKVVRVSREHGDKAIADKLNTNGHSYRGKPFTAAAVSRIRHNNKIE